MAKQLDIDELMNDLDLTPEVDSKEGAKGDPVVSGDKGAPKAEVAKKKDEPKAAKPEPAPKLVVTEQSNAEDPALANVSPATRREMEHGRKLVQARAAEREARLKAAKKG